MVCAISKMMAGGSFRLTSDRLTVVPTSPRPGRPEARARALRTQKGGGGAVASFAPARVRRRPPAAPATSTPSLPESLLSTLVPNPGSCQSPCALFLLVAGRHGAGGPSSRSGTSQLCPGCCWASTGSECQCDHVVPREAPGKGGRGGGTGPPAPTQAPATLTSRRWGRGLAESPNRAHGHPETRGGQPGAALLSAPWGGGSQCGTDS